CVTEAATRISTGVLNSPCSAEMLITLPRLPIRAPYQSDQVDSPTLAPCVHVYPARRADDRTVHPVRRLRASRRRGAPGRRLGLVARRCHGRPFRAEPHTRPPG